MINQIGNSTSTFYTEIVVKNCYLFRNFGCDFFDYIIDIGANIGMFVNCAHMRHPQAKIFAYEPCKPSFDMLVKNFCFMGNIICKNIAFGDGSPMIFCDNHIDGGNQFFKDEEIKGMQPANNYQVDSIVLYDIFKQNNINLDSNYFIKIDCEGGERFLLHDNDCIDIIKKSCGFAIEVHFPQTRGKSKINKTAERFKTFPEWHEYDAWIRDNFSNTHNIVYHMSNGMQGHGTYALIRKDL